MAINRETVKVLPVPGPPVMTAKRLSSATATATCCQSMPSGGCASGK
jgi:hypothetical protein